MNDPLPTQKKTVTRRMKESGADFGMGDRGKYGTYPFLPFQIIFASFGFLFRAQLRPVVKKSQDCLKLDLNVCVGLGLGCVPRMIGK